jgi:hypothetical protein
MSRSLNPAGDAIDLALAPHKVKLPFGVELLAKQGRINGT